MGNRIATTVFTGSLGSAATFTFLNHFLELSTTIHPIQLVILTRLAGMGNRLTGTVLTGCMGCATAFAGLDLLFEIATTIDRIQLALKTILTGMRCRLTAFFRRTGRQTGHNQQGYKSKNQISTLHDNTPSKYLN
jgi:hypothetical protein